MWAPTMWAVLAKMAASAFEAGGAALGAARIERMVDTDLYCALNIEPSADATQIRTAFRRAALQAHPDKGGSAEAFFSLTSAFNVLSCPISRSSYDQERRTKQEKACAFARRGKIQRVPARPRTIDAAELRLSSILTRIRDYLQHADRSTRQTIMGEIPSRVQTALITFMRAHPDNTRSEFGEGEKPQQRPASGSLRISHALGKSHVQLDMEHLRIYTRLCSLEDATQHESVLSNIRDRILVTSKLEPELWEDANRISTMFEEELAKNGLSQNELGMSVYVEMRAPEWIANNYHITSPVVPLAEAVSLRGRLLHARSTSWDLFRTEWVVLLQGGKNGRSLEDAEEYVNQARFNFLRQRVTHLVGNAERALDLQERLEMKEKKREEQRAAKEKKCEEQRTATKKGRKRKQNFDNNAGVQPASWPYLSQERLREHDESLRHRSLNGRTRAMA